MHNIRKIKDLDPKCGKIQTLVLYCTKIEEKTTKSNTPSNYLVFYLTDGETDIDAKRWNYSLEDFNNARVPVKIPGVVILKLEIQEYNGQPYGMHRPQGIFITFPQTCACVTGAKSAFSLLSPFVIIFPSS